MTINHRMQAVQTPIIPVVAELIRKCPGTISLGQGIVSYPPPPEVGKHIMNFWADPSNHQYKPVIGIKDLRKALAHKLITENHIKIDGTNCVVVTAGSNMAFMNAILAITSPGDEIIIQKPYYFNHEMAIVMAGCRPVPVDTDSNYQLDLTAIEQLITDKTKAIVTISPNNPTGVVYPEYPLYAFNRMCQQYGIVHISDEAYEYFTYDGVQHFSPGSILGSSNHTISLFSLSKAYGFASWRIGYMVIPKRLLESVEKIQDTILICPPVISQYAALGALEAGRNYCHEQLGQIAKVREIVINELQLLGDLCTIPPAMGAFYFFLKVNTEIDALELVKRLIQEHRVAVIPGNTFGMNDGCYLRVAYAALEPETALTGINRLVKGLQTICGG